MTFVWANLRSSVTLCLFPILTREKPSSSFISNALSVPLLHICQRALRSGLHSAVTNILSTAEKLDMDRDDRILEHSQLGVLSQTPIITGLLKVCLQLSFQMILCQRKWQNHGKICSVDFYRCLIACAHQIQPRGPFQNEKTHLIGYTGWQLSWFHLHSGWTLRYFEYSVIS